MPRRLPYTIAAAVQKLLGVRLSRLGSQISWDGNGIAGTERDTGGEERARVTRLSSWPTRRALGLGLPSLASSSSLPTT